MKQSFFSLLRHRQLNAYICHNCIRQLSRQRRNASTTSSKSSRPDIYDVVCVGGGPAGLSLLTALRSSPTTSPLKTLLIESSPLSLTPTWFPIPTTFSNRCSSLTPSSISFLQEIGAWKHINKSRIQEYENMQVWDGVSGARISFDWNETGNIGGRKGGEAGKTIAVMNENINLTTALLQRLKELGGVEIEGATRVEGIGYGKDEEGGEEGLDLSQWPVLRLSNGREIAARLLIGADGANSLVRQFAGIESRGWDYERQGVVATLELEEAPGEQRKTAYQRFLPEGPIALLPLPGRFASLVWSTTPEYARGLKDLEAKKFLAMVNAAFRLGVVDLRYMHTLPKGQTEELEWRKSHTSFDVSKIPAKVVAVQGGSIALFPLKMRHADTYISERIALVGDAAHTIHPLAGQGLNQGQGDVERLVKQIEWAVSHGMDVGSRMALEGYVEDRYAKNHLLAGTVDKLHKVYGVESGLVVGARSLGLRAVDGLGGLKGWFMGQAGGRRRLGRWVDREKV